MPYTAPVVSHFITVLTTEYLRTHTGNAEERATVMLQSTLL